MGEISLSLFLSLLNANEIEFQFQLNLHFSIWLLFDSENQIFLPSTRSPSYKIHVKIHRWNCSSFDSTSWPIELIVIGKTKITFKWYYKMENCRLICAAMPTMEIVSARVWKIPPHSILNYSKVTAKFEGEKKKKKKHMTLHSSNSHLEVYRRLLALSVNLYINWRNRSLGNERWTRTY